MRAVCGLWFAVCGLWFAVCGLWFVVCGLWFCNLRCVVCGLWSVMRDMRMNQIHKAYQIHKAKFQGVVVGQQAPVQQPGKQFLMSPILQLRLQCAGLGFGVWGLGFGVWGLEFGVWVFET